MKNIEKFVVEKKAANSDTSNWQPVIYDATHDSLAEATQRAERMSGKYKWRIVQEVTTRTVVRQGQSKE